MLYCVLSDAVKEGSPENDDLERLGNKVINVWKQLGRRLFEGAEEVVDAIDKDYHNIREEAYQMLKKWKEAKGTGATFQVLHDALCHDFVQRKDLAEEFCLVAHG